MLFSLKGFVDISSLDMRLGLFVVRYSSCLPYKEFMMKITLHFTPMSLFSSHFSIVFSSVSHFSIGCFSLRRKSKDVVSYCEFDA